MSASLHDVALIAPFLVLLGTAALVVAADLFAPRIERSALPFISLGGIGAAAAALVRQWGVNSDAFGGAVRVDDLSVVIGIGVLAATALSVLMSATYVRAGRVDFGEYYALMLTATAGALLLVQAGDLMSIFLGVEVLSISVYCLTGITRDREKSTEAAMKYFVMGAFASGFLLFGMALLYAGVMSGGFSPSGPAALSLQAIADTEPDHPLFLAGLSLFLAGVAFKIGAVPFHAWTPDAYEGAPAPVTGFMSAVVKASVFGALLRTAIVAFPGIRNEASGMIAILAGATMIVGNLFAVAQTNLKRLLAYSSIAHTGYALVGVVAASASEGAAAAVVFYVITYAVVTVGSFGLISLVTRDTEELEDVSKFAGLASRRPLAAAAMVLFMASLAGIPPTVGFMGKLLIFREAVAQDHLLLAGIGIATSMVSAFYYLKIVVSMYMREPARNEEFPLGPDRWGASFGLAVAAVVTILLGLLPAKVIEWSMSAMSSLR